MNGSLRLAFLGDVHGNLPALEAVLLDLERQAPDAVFLLGDLINRCPWTVELLDLVRQLEWPSVQGNHDQVLSLLHTGEGWDGFQDRRRFPNVHWTWEQLRPQDISFLRNLPEDLLIEIEGAPGLRLFHGLPGNPFEGIVPGAEERQVAAEVALYDEQYIVCGHTHQPLDRTVGTEAPVPGRLSRQPRPRRILNPGSIGMPYNGDPRAQYLLLDLVGETGGGRVGSDTSEQSTRVAWQPKFCQVEYDLKRVQDAFHSSGLIASSGPIAKLNLRTIQDGEPWASDYARWVRDQPVSLRSDPVAAVDLYLQSHGPSRWSFSG